jgi:ADP-heptose:LPS heptosyltransferase
MAFLKKWNYYLVSWFSFLIFNPFNTKLIFCWLYLHPKYWKKTNNAVTSIVVIRPDLIGDFILFTPFLRELKELYPKAHLCLVCRKIIQPLIKECPYVDKVIFYEGFKYITPHFIKSLQIIRLCMKHFWKSPPDLVILPRRGTDQYLARMMAYLTIGKRRIGYLSYKTLQQLYTGFDMCYLNELVYIKKFHREVYFNLFLVWYLGKRSFKTHTELWISEKTHLFSKCLLFNVINKKSIKVVLGVGSSSRIKCWSIQNYAALIFELNKKYKIHFLLLGGYGEQKWNDALGYYFKNKSILDFTNQIKLDESAAVISQCDLYIGSDSCLKHMAALYGLPVVELQLFPKELLKKRVLSPLLFRPYQTPYIIIQPDSIYSNYLDRISIDEVLDSSIHMVEKYCLKEK